MGNLNMFGTPKIDAKLQAYLETPHMQPEEGLEIARVEGNHSYSPD